MSDDYQRIELITGTAHRRRWTTEQKLRIIETSYEPGESVLVQDPAKPNKIRADFNKGDDLHPNDAGYKAMAESIDLKMLAAQ